MSILPYHLRRPTEAAAVGRTQSRLAPTATVAQLRTRLCRAVEHADSHGIRLLAAHLARAVG